MKVKVKIRPQETLPFPGICVHCARPASGQMEVRRRIGRVKRMVDVPLCAGCHQELHQLSAAEKRWQKRGRLAAAGVLPLALAVTLLLTPAEMPFGLRFLLALLVGLAAAKGLLLWFRRQMQNGALPEKRSIRAAASIVYFSWRATTFDFTNETFAVRFRQLNEPYLMEL